MKVSDAGPKEDVDGVIGVLVSLCFLFLPGQAVGGPAQGGREAQPPSRARAGARPGARAPAAPSRAFCRKHPKHPGCVKVPASNLARWHKAGKQGKKPLKGVEGRNLWDMSNPGSTHSAVSGGVGLGGWGAGGAVGGSPPPTPRVYPGAHRVRGRLDPAIVRRVMRRHNGELRYCYMKAGLAADPGLSGKVGVRFVIDSSGKIDRVSITHNKLRHKPTERCILAAIKRWRFPKPDRGKVSVITHYVFKPPPGRAVKLGVGAMLKKRGTIPRGAVVRVFNRHKRDIWRCYLRARKSVPGLRGRMQAELAVLPSGRVSHVSISGSTLTHPGVVPCVRKAIRRMRFPRPRGGKVVIRYPLVFR